MESVADTRVPVPPRSLPLGEIISGGIVLGLAGLVLALFASTLDAGKESFGARGRSTPHLALPTAMAAPPSPGVPLVILAVGEDRAAELRLSLEKESELRVALGEQLREAEVVVVSDPTTAEIAVREINRQSAIPGASPMAAVVVP